MAEKDPLVKCPNYNVCQSMVKQSKAGQEHKFGVYDREQEKMVYITCPGS